MDKVIQFEKSPGDFGAITPPYDEVKETHKEWLHIIMQMQQYIIEFSANRQYWAERNQGNTQAGTVEIF